MGDKSGIEWTEATWNPIAGCSILSPGCLNCYAMRQAARILRMHPDKPNPKYVGTVKTVNGNAVWTGKVNVGDDEVFLQPLRWKTPKLIFVNSMSDIGHKNVSDETILRIFAVMAIAQRHTFQVLTKRPERLVPLLQNSHIDVEIEDRANEIVENFPGFNTPEGPTWPLPNVWLGVSAENQETYDKRSLDLLRIDAEVRWISFEPLLGPIQADMVGAFDWAVVGGESGEGARPMDVAWAADLALQCQSQDVAFFMKQLGGVRDKRGELGNFPVALRVREYPKAVRA